jgi:hypothetical protein
MNPALISLRIAAILYFILAAVIVVLSFSLDKGLALIFMSLVAFGMGYLMLKIRLGLIAGKYWAWVAGIIISGMQVFSIFFPLGIMGLIGLLNTKTRQAFNAAADQKVVV